MKRKAKSLELGKNGQTSEGENWSDGMVKASYPVKRRNSEEERERLRRNQRNSRARRAAADVPELETQWFLYARLEARAAAEMRIEAGRVYAENMVLRTMLHDRGCDTQSINDMVNSATVRATSQSLDMKFCPLSLWPPETIQSQFTPWWIGNTTDTDAGLTPDNHTTCFQGGSIPALIEPVNAMSMSSTSMTLDIESLRNPPNSQWGVGSSADLQGFTGSFTMKDSLTTNADFPEPNVDNVIWSSWAGQPDVRRNPEPENSGDTGNRQSHLE